MKSKLNPSCVQCLKYKVCPVPLSNKIRPSASVPQSTPRSSRSLMIDAGVARKTSFNSPSSKEPVLDEWEAKLLGKRSAVPYKANDDALSMHSQFSLDDKTNSLKRIGQDPDRQKAMAIPEVRQVHH